MARTSAGMARVCLIADLIRCLPCRLQTGRLLPRLRAPAHAALWRWSVSDPEGGSDTCLSQRGYRVLYEAAEDGQQVGTQRAVHDAVVAGEGDGHLPGEGHA